VLIAATVLLMWVSIVSDVVDVRHPGRCHERRIAPLGSPVLAIDDVILLDRYCGTVFARRWSAGAEPVSIRAATPASASRSPLPTTTEIAAQWLALIATALVLGCLSIRAWVIRDPAASSVASAIDERIGTVLRGALAFLTVASVAEVASAIGLLGSAPQLGGAFGPLGKVGALALLRAALAPMIGFLAAKPDQTWMALGFAGILVLTRAQAGHASTAGFGAILVDAAHQLAALTWLGCVVLAVAGWREMRRFWLVDPRALGRMLSLGAASIVTAVVLGIASIVTLGIDRARLLADVYGQALVAKVVVVFVATVAGFLAWRVWQGAPARGRRALLVEAACGVAVVGLAGWLALLPPPTVPPTGPWTMPLPIGDRWVALSLSAERANEARINEARINEARIEAIAVGADGRPIDALSVSHRAEPVGPSPGDAPAWWEVTVDVGGRTRVVDVSLPPVRPASAVESDPAAERLFRVALGRITSAVTAEFEEIVGDGNGGVLAATSAVDRDRGFRVLTALGEEMVATGGRAWIRAGGQSWRSREWEGGPPTPRGAIDYSQATAFQFALSPRADEIVIAFDLPAIGARALWRIDADGLVTRETIVAQGLYLSSTLLSVDRPVAVDRPE
jgi:putative copper export protein